MSSKFAGVCKYNGNSIRLVKRAGSLYVSHKDVCAVTGNPVTGDPVTAHSDITSNAVTPVAIFTNKLTCFDVISLADAVKIMKTTGSYRAFRRRVEDATIDNFAVFATSIDVNGYALNVYVDDSHIYFDIDCLHALCSLETSVIMMPAFDVFGNYSLRCLVDESELYMNSSRYCADLRDYVHARANDYHMCAGLGKLIAECIDTECAARFSRE